MTRTWLVFWHEYWRNITRRSYIIFTFGFPLFVLLVPLIGGIVLFLAIRSAMPVTDPRPIGVIDQPSLFTEPVTPPNDPVEVILFDTPEAAQTALETGEIQAYYDIQPDYWDSGQIVMMYDVAPTEAVDAMFLGWVGNRVRAEAPADLVRRLSRGPTITHQDLSGTESFSVDNIAESALVFLVIYFVRLGSAFTAEYMFGSIAREARDRTLEILITTISPLQLVVGKLVGLLAVGLTQLGTWATAIFLLSFGASRLMGFDLLTTLLSWDHLWLLASLTLAAYILDQTLAATLGMFRVSGGAGSMLFNTFNWVVGLGLIYAIYFVPRNPHSVGAIIASFIPITAPIVLLIRVVVSEVPLWQTITAQLCMWAAIIGNVFWLRWLLKTNLVSNAPPFQLRTWLKQTWQRRRKKQLTPIQ
ncbi:MAG: ABC transporter permease [Chloroflexota bacterium]